jgi:hypothetical protein
MQQTAPIAHPSGSVRSQYGPVWGFVMRHLINPAMRAALASRRFHAPLGSSTLMVLAFRGRRSGTPYRFPIGYLQEGATLTCYTPFGWWRNLVGGAPVTVNLRGRRLAGTADASTDLVTVQAGMDVYLRHNPGDAKFFSVRVDHGVPNPADVALAAQKNAQIRIRLDQAA